jgi:dihydrofolate reductase
MKLIVACTPSGGIGYKGRLPWSNIQGDLQRFKKLTTSQTILMGRNTWESLPKKPLPNRNNIVVTSTSITGATTVSGVIDEFGKLDNIWVIGGAKLINSCLHLINEVHLTRVTLEYECDVFIDIDKVLEAHQCIMVEHCDDHTYEVWRKNETVS